MVCQQLTAAVDAEHAATPRFVREAEIIERLSFSFNWRQTGEVML